MQSSKCQNHITDICYSTYQVVQLGDLLLVVILDGGFVALFELSEGNTHLDSTTKTIRKCHQVPGVFYYGNAFHMSNFEYN